MANELMSFPRFKRIMETLLEFKARKERIEDFVEKEVASDSFFLISYNSELEQTLVNMLADEFDCWFEINWTNSQNHAKDWWECEINPDKDNDISYWLYEFLDNEKKVIEVDGQELDISTIDKLYNYLISRKENKNLTK